MATLQEELSRQMAMKAVLVQTTATPGWQVIKQIADKIVEKHIQEALDEEDRDKGESKRYKAKALQKGFSELFGFIDSVKQYDPNQTTDDSGFGQLEFNNAKQ